jgi:hypothetical protein
MNKPLGKDMFTDVLMHDNNLNAELSIGYQGARET